MAHFGTPLSPVISIASLSLSDDSPVLESKALTFSGDESVADFVQAIQKHAFENDRSSDDRWIAAYAGTCFAADAALWYSDLDDEERNDWNKLRKALVARYGAYPVYTCGTQVIQPLPVVSPYMSPVQPRRRGPTYVPCGPAPTIIHPVRARAPNELRGHIEVFVPERNLWLGFVTYDYDSNGSAMNFNLVGSKDTASLVSFEPDSDGKPIQLRVVDGTIDMQHPYMGLALEERPHQLPGQTVWPQPPVIYGGAYPTGCCSPYIPAPPMTPYVAPTPLSHGASSHQPAEAVTPPSIWTLKPCTESKQEERYRRAAKTANLWEKASAAIWKYDADTKELSVTWMNDDGTEEELGVSVPKSTTTYPGPTPYPGITLRPQFRRVKDNTGEALNPSKISVWQNVPVKLIFVPEDEE